MDDREGWRESPERSTLAAQYDDDEHYANKTIIVKYLKPFNWMKKIELLVLHRNINDSIFVYSWTIIWLCTSFELVLNSNTCNHFTECKQIIYSD